jgi:HK97 family phage major capsid protein
LRGRLGHLAIQATTIQERNAMPGEVVKRLRDRRLNVWEEAKKLADSAAEESRSFSGEEQDSWDRLNAELDALDRRIKSMLDGEKREAEAAGVWDTLMGKPRQQQGETVQAGPTPAQFANELRSWLRGDRGRSFDVATPGGPINWRALSQFGYNTEQRVLTTTTASSGEAGGATIPTTFYNRLMAHVIEVSGVLQAGPTIFNTNSGETFTIPKTLTHSVPSGAGIVTEASAIPAAEPTFGQTTLGAYKYGILLQLSRELIDDTGVDLEGYLAMQAGRALGNIFGSQLTAGTGTTQPRGILKDTTAGATGATGVAGAPSATDLLTLMYSVISPYRSSRSCGWLMADSTVGKVRAIRDKNEQFIWQPSITLGTPDVLFGKPVYTDPYVPTTAVSGAVNAGKSVIFGDFSSYAVRLVGGVRFERSDDLAFDQDLVTFRAILRGDGATIDLHGALKHYIGNAA